MHQLDEPWRELASDASLDIALLQEAKPPPAGVIYEVLPARDSNWKMPRYRRAFRNGHRSSFRPRVPEGTPDDRPCAGDRARGARARLGDLARDWRERTGTPTVVDVTWGKEVFLGQGRRAPREEGRRGFWGGSSPDAGVADSWS